MPLMLEEREVQRALVPSDSSDGDDVTLVDMASEDPVSSEEVMAEPSSEDSVAAPMLATAIVMEPENDQGGTTNDDSDSFFPLLNAAKAGLDAMGLSYDVRPQNDDGVTTMTFRADLSAARGITIRILIKESAELFMLLLSLPTLIPEEHRTAVSKYWTHVNYYLNVGNFEMDLSDGEVRFRVGTVVKNAPLSPEMVTSAVETAANAATIYLPGQFYMLYGDMDYEEAYQTARNKL
eukprot:Nitzschia sp. Nitz4//scaffold346_size17405//14447//15154//NITZ4_008832-RA/size17405-processed-gene-0.6-mRNA-1//-1//CDS//3329548656//2690//frame0